MMGKPAIRTLQMGIVQSKTDQAKNGAVVLLCENAEKPEHCPVDRWEEYLKVKEAAGIVSEVAFPTEKGARMSASTPCHIVQKAVERANERYEESARAEGRDEPEKWGVPSAYGSHSLRRGGVTQARQNNVAMVDIQRHGRWKSLTVFAYVGLSAEEQRGVTRNFLAGATNGSSESSRTPKDSVPSRMASQLEAGGAAAVEGENAAMKSEEKTAAEGVVTNARKNRNVKRKADYHSDSEEEEPTAEEVEEERVSDLLFAEEVSQGYGDEEMAGAAAGNAVHTRKRASKKQNRRKKNKKQ